MLFLKAILDKNEQSLVAKFFKLQLEQPTKGDWVSTCINDLKEMNVELDLNEIRMMTKENFKKIIKMKISEISLEYLLRKRGSKGKEIKYDRLEMADYLQPYNKTLTLEEKRQLFSVRNRMVEIGYNFGKYEKCIMCGEYEDMTHIYSCEYLNEEETNIKFEKIFNGNMIEQMKVFRTFEKNMNKRNERKSENKNPPGDPFCDPLNCGKFSIG